jgi:hypothetical protein
MGGAPALKELRVRYRRVDERATRRAHGDAKEDLRIGEGKERLEAEEELLAQGRFDDVRRETELVNEDLAMEAPRGERAQE